MNISEMLVARNAAKAARHTKVKAALDKEVDDLRDVARVLLAARNTLAATPVAEEDDASHTLSADHTRYALTEARSAVDAALATRTAVNAAIARIARRSAALDAAIAKRRAKVNAATDMAVDEARDVAAALLTTRDTLMATPPIPVKRYKRGIGALTAARAAAVDKYSQARHTLTAARALDALTAARAAMEAALATRAAVNTAFTAQDERFAEGKTIELTVETRDATVVLTAKDGFSVARGAANDAENAARIAVDAAVRLKKAARGGPAVVMAAVLHAVQLAWWSWGSAKNVPRIL